MNSMTPATVPQLRPYQLDAIQRMRLAISQGSRSVLVVSPTGSGKTTIASEIVRSAVERGRTCQWLAHRSELLDQGFDRLREFGLPVGMIAAESNRPPNPYAPVQVASIQTLLARPNARKAADVVIWDECHHAVGDEWSALAAYHSKATLLGFTATPERSDGKGLGSIFTSIVVAISAKQLIELGHLVACDIKRPGAKLRPGRIAQRPVDAYREHAMGRPTICFSPSVPAALAHLAEFIEAGITAAVVHGKMNVTERALTIDAYRRGHVRVLVNVYVLTEGFDAPETSCIILARGCGTAGTYIQMCGRGARPAPGKSDYILLDLHGVSHVLESPDDDRRYSLDGRGISSGCDDEVDQTPSCRVCSAPILAGEACAECGTEPREIALPKVTGEPLVKYAAKRSESDEKRAETLARWIAQGRAAGYKPGFPRGRYRAVYGELPPYSIEREAEEIAARRGAA